MNNRNVMLLVLLTTGLALPSLTGCAASSPPTPPVVGQKVRLTPLPADVTQIAPSDSAGYLKKLSDFRTKVNALSDDATPK